MSALCFLPDLLQPVWLHFCPCANSTWHWCPTNKFCKYLLSWLTVFSQISKNMTPSSLYSWFSRTIEIVGLCEHTKCLTYGIMHIKGYWYLIWIRCQWILSHWDYVKPGFAFGLLGKSIIVSLGCRGRISQDNFPNCSLIFTSNMSPHHSFQQHPHYSKVKLRPHFRCSCSFVPLDRNHN